MLKLIIWVVIFLLVLSFFGVSLQHVIESPTTQGNFGYLGDLLQLGWNDLVALVNGLWNGVTPG